MRTTLDIDDDVLAAAKELSRQQGCSAGQMVSALLRRALTGGADVRASHTLHSPEPVAGFEPFRSRGAPVTNADVDRLRDIEGV